MLCNAGRAVAKRISSESSVKAQLLTSTCQQRRHASSGSSKNIRMIIFGPPGSGKGTQTEKLEKDYGLVSASTGNLLRQAIADGTPMGLKVKDILARGALVDDATMLGLVDELVRTKFPGNNWILDGFPRTMAQATGLDAILDKNSQPLNMALMLNVPDDIIVERISNRWTHVPSGRVYHTSYKPPKNPGVDDETGEKLVQREDDKEENVRARLVNYRNYTQPLLEYYNKKGILKTVSAKTSHEGYVEIRRIMDEHKKLLGL